MKFYIYHHIRPDTNTVFYVGRGKWFGKPSWKGQRAHYTKDRNFGWQKIVKTNDGKFNVVIVKWCETFEEAKQAEIEEIAKFGRENDGSGILCNLTNGGDGCNGFKHDRARLKAIYYDKNPNRSDFTQTAEFKAKISASNLGRGAWNKGIKATGYYYQRIVETRSRGAKHYIARPVVDISTGVIYECAREAIEANPHINMWTIYAALRGDRINKTNLRYEDAL